MYRKNSTVFAFGVILVGALALGAGGCGGGGSPQDQVFTVSWTVQFIGDPASTCDSVGAAQVDLDLLDVGTSQAFHDNFPCSAARGTSRALAAGDYTWALRLRDSSGALISEYVGNGITLFRGSGQPLGGVKFGIQSFKLSWSIQRVSGALLTCAQAGATTVELQTQIGTMPVVAYDFDCNEPTGGSTTAITPNVTYNVVAQLLDASKKVLSATATRVFPVDDHTRADLGPIAFSVN